MFNGVHGKAVVVLLHRHAESFDDKTGNRSSPPLGYKTLKPDFS